MADKVLLVDDDEEFTSALSERLKTRGFLVDVAARGREAIEKEKRGSYGAVVLDLAMPGMDGIETYRRLRAQNADLQVILLSGEVTLDQGVEAVKLGVMDVLEKPLDIERLTDRIKQAQAKKMVILQTRIESEVQEILRSKAW
jgi:DNA-binding response OmpR family regulator